MLKPLCRCLILVQVLSLHLAYGQQPHPASPQFASGTGSVRGWVTNQADTLLVADTNKLPSEKPAYVIRTLAVPMAMITYGVIALKSPPLLQLNRNVHKMVSVEDSYGTFHLESYLQWTPVLAAYALNLSGIKGKNNFVDRTIIYGISIILMSSTVYEVKKISKETRPDGYSPYSFPSGHTANAFANAEFLRHEYKDVSPWYAVGGYAAAAATGYLRLYHNRHWLSDVIGGAGVGILSANAAYLIYPHIKRLFLRNRHLSSTVILPAYQNGVVSIGAVRAF